MDVPRSFRARAEFKRLRSRRHPGRRAACSPFRNHACGIRPQREAMRFSELQTHQPKSVEAWAKLFPIIDIDSLKPGDVARWLMDRYKLNSQIARYLVDNVGADLYQLHNEIEKLRTYVGEGREIEPRDVDVLILRSEQYGPFELDDAVLASNYK